MHKPLRLLLFVLFAHSSLYSSSALTTTSKMVISGIGSASLIPFYIAQLPFAVVAEVFFDKKIGKRSTQTTQEVVPIKTLEEPSITTSPSSVLTQVAQPIVSIPEVISEVVSVLPKEHSKQPLFINVNVNTQQAALSSQNATSCAAAKNPPVITAPPPSDTRWSWIKKPLHTYVLIGGLLTYGGLHLYLWRVAKALRCEDNWSRWRPLSSLKDLYQTNQAELLKNLMTSCEDLYHHDNELHNAQQFTKEAEKELSLLTYYRQTVSTWYGCRLFFVDRSFIETIPERIQRLEFLKGVVTRWIKEHRQAYCYDKLFAQS